MKKIFFPLILSIVLFSEANLFASQRQVYFSAIGQNRVVSAEGLANDAQSSCIVTITNTSGVDQYYAVDMRKSNEDDVAVSGAPYDDTSVSSNWHPLPSGQSATVTVSFTSFKTMQTKNVACIGAITVKDDTTPGFVSANGTLITFFESGVQQTANATNATTYGSQAVYSQTPVPINAGKPF